MAPGLFGELDAEEVSDDPFYVAADTYRCVLTDASRVTEEDEYDFLSFRWTIEDDDSEYEGNTISDRLNVWPDVAAEDLTADQKKDNARCKQRLTQMGLTPMQMNVLLEDENLADLVGLEAYVKVVNNEGKGDNEGRTFTNVRKVTLLDEAA